MIRLSNFRVFGFIDTKWLLALNQFVIRQNTGQKSIKNCRLKTTWRYVRRDLNTFVMLRRCSYTLLSSMSKYVAMIIVNAYVVRLHITYFLCRL